jgi:hypothetical protein
MSDKATHYYLPGSGGSVTGPHIKEASFFIAQGGLREKWGNAWKPITCDSDVESARALARKLERQNGNLQYPETKDGVARLWGELGHE